MIWIGSELENEKLVEEQGTSISNDHRGICNLFKYSESVMNYLVQNSTLENTVSPNNQNDSIALIEFTSFQLLSIQNLYNWEMMKRTENYLQSRNR